VKDTTWSIYIGCIIVACAGIAAFGNSVFAAFVLDDRVAVIDNLSLRRLWPIQDALFAERESPLAGRPLVNVSLALNYAMAGLDPRLYHAVNVAIHVGCAVLLALVIYRTCQLARIRPRVPEPAWLATACALLWAVHPLNSEAVDYVTQRTELMMAAAFLLTLYLSLRAADGTRPWIWQCGAVLACACGMACKESMVTAPIVVLLFDRAFLYDSFRDAVRVRWRLYLGLASTWIVLAALMWTGPRMHSTGFSTGVGAWTYLLNQSEMILRYLQLSVWPSSLVAAYGYPRMLTMHDVWLPMLLVGGLAVASVALFLRRPGLGFLGLWVFITLAPTSSIVPIATEVGAERRMYLPLAGLVVGAVLLAWRIAGRLARLDSTRHLRVASGTLVFSIAAIFTAVSFVRGREYESEVLLTTHLLERWPTGHSHALLAVALTDAGRRDEALAHLRLAVEGDPRARFPLGSALFDRHKYDEANREFEEFVRLEPALAEVVDARDAMGVIASIKGDPGTAETHFRAALAMNPGRAGARVHLADTLLAQSRFVEAIKEYRSYLRLKPADDQAVTSLGVALLGAGSTGADATFQRALTLNPQNERANRTLAAVYVQRGDYIDAAAYARRAVQLAPDDALAHDILGVSLAFQSKLDEALAEFEQATRLNPGDVSIREHYQTTLQDARRRAATGAR
jgi:tetratricopeptide (TPR) repeat protein